jgi:malate dehydrogenase (oxaloacetate-decarboxylating)(NADP+)
MGLSRPVHVLQRGAEVNDIVNIAAVAVVDAQDAGTPVSHGQVQSVHKS